MNIPLAWRGLLVAALALACAVVVLTSDASTPAKVATVVALMVAITLWRTARELRVHATINRHAALGQPEPILHLVDMELARSKAPRVQVPFSIYKAMALAMKGQWQDGLAVLDGIDMGSMRGKVQRTWQFLYHSHRVTCLLFTGRVDEAERVVTESLAPYAEIVRSPATRVMVDEARAKLAFFQDRLDDSRVMFEALAGDERIAPGSRAVYHYFLGRIARALGHDASPHLAAARELGPDTFVARDMAEHGP